MDKMQTLKLFLSNPVICHKQSCYLPVLFYSESQILMAIFGRRLLLSIEGGRTIGDIYFDWGGSKKIIVWGKSTGHPST